MNSPQPIRGRWDLRPKNFASGAQLKTEQASPSTSGVRQTNPLEVRSNRKAPDAPLASPKPSYPFFIV
jgi:hypothetical protein